MEKMTPKPRKWYCYVCGASLHKTYFLCSMREDTDRVFLCCPKCVKNIDNETFKIEITEYN